MAPELPEMTLEQAIQIIQVHERARQGRVRAKFLQELREREELKQFREAHPPKKLSQDEAAAQIREASLL